MYRCDGPDEVVLSRVPCAADAVCVEVRTALADPDSSSRREAEPEALRLERARNHWRIANLYAEQRRPERERDAEILAAWETRLRAPNNLAGAT